MDNNIPKYISQEQQEEFESFLLGDMTVEEEISFNQKLEKDPTLQSQFEEFKTLFFVVEEQGLRMKLDEFHSNFEIQSASKKSNFNSYRIAAGVAILLSLGLWFLNRPSHNERLYKEYFSPDPGLPTVMGSNDNYDFYEAMVDYKQGNYEVAIEKWEKLLIEKPSNDTLNYFLGVSHLAKNNTVIAINYLTSVSEMKNSVFYDESNTYLGLAFLKEGKTDDAKIVFSRSNSEKSKTLQSQIE